MSDLIKTDAKQTQKNKFPPSKVIADCRKMSVIVRKCL